MSFWTLALIGVLALLGPLVALPRGWHVPLVLGELAAGVAFGDSGLRLLHPSDQTFTFLADIGFALMMLTAGAAVPVRDAAVRTGLGRAALRVLLVGVFTTGLGAAISAAFDMGHGTLYAVLIGSSSAALALPVIDSLGLRGPRVIELIAQVAIADTLCIVALPLVVDPAHVPRVIVGAVAVTAAAVALFVALTMLEKSGVRRRVHEVSEARRFAVELRVSLIGLFVLAAVATSAHVSIMIAGFAAGLAVAGVGEPRRVAHQLFAVSDGFFAPLFFVWFGAQIDLRSLAEHPDMLLLGVALAAAAIVAHTAMRLTGQPISLGVIAAGQLGVPVAAVTVGTSAGLFAPGEAGAIMLGAVLTIVALAAVGRLAVTPASQ